MNFIAFAHIGIIIVVIFALFGAAPLHAREVVLRIPGRGKSQVPAWNLRGVGPLPWQGIACADVSPDGRFVALGTIAPVGDPQVFVLDAHGTVSAQYRAGERWINEVAISHEGALASALITTPQATAGDEPWLLSFANGKPVELRGIERSVGYGGLFHYGDHSNHLAPVLDSQAQDLVIAARGRVSWVGAAPDFPVRGVAVGGDIISMAVSPTGRTVVGSAVTARERSARSVNLTVADGGKLLWQRPLSDDVAPAPAPEAGVYGPPASTYEDVKVWAPLSVAISRPNDTPMSPDSASRAQVS